MIRSSFIIPEIGAKIGKIPAGVIAAATIPEKSTFENGVEHALNPQTYASAYEVGKGLIQHMYQDLNNATELSANTVLYFQSQIGGGQIPQTLYNIF